MDPKLLRTNDLEPNPEVVGGLTRRESATFERSENGLDAHYQTENRMLQSMLPQVAMGTVLWDERDSLCSIAVRVAS